MATIGPSQSSSDQEQSEGVDAVYAPTLGHGSGEHVPASQQWAA